MTIRIGERYSSSNQTRVTSITYDGLEFSVIENYWEYEADNTLRCEWNVTADLSVSSERMEGETELRSEYRNKLAMMDVLAGLGYTLDYTEDGAAFYSKEVEDG